MIDEPVGLLPMPKEMTERTFEALYSLFTRKMTDVCEEELRQLSGNPKIPHNVLKTKNEPPEQSS